MCEFCDSLVPEAVRMEKEIKIKYFNDVQEIEALEVGDWIDLRSAESVDIKAGEYKLIRLGVAMELPEGYEALVAPRSSTFKNYGILLANSLTRLTEGVECKNFLNLALFTNLRITSSTAALILSSLHSLR